GQRRVVLLGGGVHERVVQLERRLARLERQASLVLHGVGERRVGGGRGGETVHDVGRHPAGVVDRHVAVVVEDPAAGGRHEAVDPHREALVLGASSSIRPGLPCWRSATASLIIWPHVAGGTGTRALRYHTSCEVVL